MKKLPASLIKSIDTVKDATIMLQGELQDAKEKAEEYFEDRSDKWKEGDKGQAYEQWIEELEGAVDSLQEVLDNIPTEPAE